MIKSPSITPGVPSDSPSENYRTKRFHQVIKSPSITVQKSPSDSPSIVTKITNDENHQQQKSPSETPSNTHSAPSGLPSDITKNR